MDKVDLIVFAVLTGLSVVLWLLIQVDKWRNRIKADKEQTAQHKILTEDDFQRARDKLIQFEPREDSVLDKFRKKYKKDLI